MLVNRVCMHFSPANWPGRPSFRGACLPQRREVSLRLGLQQNLPGRLSRLLGQALLILHRCGWPFGVVAIAAGAPISSAFTRGVILSAFLTSCLTCQICDSVKWLLN